MLNDAHLKRITAIPADLMPEYPVDPETFECTRLVMDKGALLKKADKFRALRLVVFGLCDVSARLGAKRLISLSPEATGGLLRMIGYDAKALGRSYQGKEDGISYCAFEMTCDADVNSDLGKLHSFSVLDSSPDGNVLALLH